jgi:anti-anti-sigma factor
VVPATVVHGQDEGDFDYLAQLDEWEARLEAAVADGFSGLRVAIDMTWLDEVELSLNALVDYERRGSELIAKLPGTGICLCIYDRRRFHDHTLARASHAHSIRFGAAAERTELFASSGLAISTAGPGALALAGELDMSNADALADAIAVAAHGGDALVIDMRELTFIDVAGLRAIHAASRRFGRRGDMVLLSPPSMVRRMMPVLGIDGALTLEEGPQ